MSKIRIRKRGNTYSFAFEIGKQDGKRKTYEKGGFQDRESAYSAGVEAYMDWKNGGIGLTSSNPRLKEFMQSWLENVVKGSVSNTTFNSYCAYTRLHITPKLGDLYLSDITPSVLDMWIHKLNAKGLSYNTIRFTKTVLGVALKYAVYPAEILKSNPVAFISIPRTAPRNVTERKIITQEDLIAITEKYPKFEILCKILFHTGLRIREALGLTWGCVDLENRIITVKRQIKGARGAFLHFVPPKTTKSCREVIIDNGLCKCLKDWKERQDEAFFFSPNYQVAYALENGDIIHQSISIPQPNNATKLDFVCTQETGEIISYSYFSKCLKKLGMNAHSFRHTHATMLIEGGATPKAVATRLGHADATITQNLYTHDTKKMQEDTVAIFSSMLYQ